MSYSISFYLRNQKTIYCQLVVNGFTMPKSTKKNVPDSRFWDGRYYRDPKNRNVSAEINSFLQNYFDELESICESYHNDPSFTPSRAYDLIGVSNSKDSSIPFTLLKACQYYLDTKRVRKNTLDSYQNIIDHVIIPFLKSIYRVDDVPLSKVRSRLAKDYRQYLDDQRYSNSTIHVYMGFPAAVITNIIEDYPIDEYPEIGIGSNPFSNRKLKADTRSNKLLQYVDPKLEEVAWDMLNRSKGLEHDRILIALLIWNTGLSFVDIFEPHEIINDIQLGEVFQYTRKKTGIRARIIVNHNLKKLLSIIEDNRDHYLSIYGFHLPIRFPYSRSNYVSYHRWCSTHFGEYIDSTVKLSPHILRHSFAVKLLEEGYSMDVVRIHMGHASVETTEKSYGFITNSKMFKEMHRINKMNEMNSNAM